MISFENCSNSGLTTSASSQNAASSIGNGSGSSGSSSGSGSSGGSSNGSAAASCVLPSTPTWSAASAQASAYGLYADAYLPFTITQSSGANQVCANPSSAVGSCYAYESRYDNWENDSTLQTWFTSVGCWAASTAKAYTANPTGSSPGVTRGWSNAYNYQTGVGYFSTMTTAANMGYQLANLPTARVHWSMNVPSQSNSLTENYPTITGGATPAGVWDALLDLYFMTANQGTVSTINGVSRLNPNSGSCPSPAGSCVPAWFPWVDLQIMQMTSDAAPGGYFESLAANANAFYITLGGITYAGVLDSAVFNQPGGHTVTLFPLGVLTSSTVTVGMGTCSAAKTVVKNLLSGSKATSLMGMPSATHDVAAIWKYFANSSAPVDDCGKTLVENSGAAVTNLPIVPSTLYFSAINPGYELYGGAGSFSATGAFTPAAAPLQWMTNNFWSTLPGEADGPASP